MARQSPVTRPFTLRVLIVVTHNGDRPIGSMLKEVHPNDVPRIKKMSYVTLTEPAPNGCWRIRYRRIHFVCGCIGQRPDGPRRFMPSDKEPIE
jgi:hypothetical protein